ncbi:hypothetical protein [Neorhizobium sp. R1-B]|uniref:hypothetical protein n=1 Tax=Neorhizobium sp. R1-B TaxID=2485162 RepID=UPI0010663B80|nr:hypothetical protein [Neorhizobium sp. R1-B]
MRVDDESGAHMDAADGARLFSFSTSCPHPYRTFFTDVYDDVTFLIAMFDRATRDNRELRHQLTSERPDLAKECARYCDDSVFKRYLADVYGLDTADRERVAAGVRKILGIKSRSELNTKPEAARAWNDLRGRFEAWRLTA